MDTTSASRKRTGRPPKAVIAQQTDANSEHCLLLNSESGSPLIDTIAVPGSTTYDEPGAVGQFADAEGTMHIVSCNQEELLHSASTFAGGVSTGSGPECRRSSRKKIIKFDVRDLLNKNRRPHKIQIEARIDSNAPTPLKPAAHVATSPSATATDSTTNCGKKDLTTNQKTFIEKAAIFRRFSISEQQNKGISQLRPPSLLSETNPKLSLLGKAGNSDEDATLRAADLAKIAQTRRLSRTQEIFNASMMKSKQNSSLIVAQMESRSGSICSNMAFANTLSAIQKKNGGGRKKGAKVLSIATPDGSRTISEGITVTQKKRGRPPKSKIAEKSTVTFEEGNIDLLQYSLTAKDNSRSEADVTGESNKVETIPDKQSQKLAISVSNKQPENARNWQEYKALLKETDAVETTTEKQFLLDFHGQEVKTARCAPLQIAPEQDIVLEISSSNSEFVNCDGDAMLSDAKNKISLAVLVNESKQRNFAAVSFLQENVHVDNDSDNITAPDFIVAAVEEILTPTTEICESAGTSGIEHKNVCVDDERGNVTVDPSSQSNETGDELFMKELPSRCSASSSESETNSERSKSYKKGDKLRINLKRVSITRSPVTSASSSTSSSSEIVFLKASADNVFKKESTAKAKKRLTKKIATANKEDIPQACGKVADIITVEYIGEEHVKEESEGKDLSENKVNTETIQMSSSTIKDVTCEEINKLSNVADQENSEKTKDIVLKVTKKMKLKTDMINTQKISSYVGENIEESDKLEKEEITTDVVEFTLNIDKVEAHIVKSNEDYNQECALESKRGNFTLPLKKQVSKFQIFKTDVAKENVTATKEAALEARAFAESAVIQKVNAGRASPLQNESLKCLEEISSSLAKVLADTVTTKKGKDIPDNITASIESDKSATDIDKNVDVMTKEAALRSEITSPHCLRKVTRRYERRSRHGEAAPRTLEETFAEIAAESSKEILELTALKINRKKDDQEKVVELINTSNRENTSQSNNNIKEFVREQYEEQKEVIGDRIKSSKVSEISEEILAATLTRHMKEVDLENITNLQFSQPAVKQALTLDFAIIKKHETTPKEAIDLSTEEFDKLGTSQNVMNECSISSPVRIKEVFENKSVEMPSSGSIEDFAIRTLPTELERKEIKKTDAQPNVTAACSLNVTENMPQDRAGIETTNCISLQSMEKNKEDRTGGLPPKKRHSKIQAELGNLEMLISQTDSKSAIDNNTSTCGNEIGILKQDCLNSITTCNDEGTDSVITSMKKTKKATKMDEVIRNDTIVKHAQTDEDSPVSKFEITPTRNKQNVEGELQEQSIISGKKKQKKFIEDSKSKIEKSSSKGEDKEKEKEIKVKNADKKVEECATVEISKRLEEKSAKKKRQKRLKEAFEAALSEDIGLLRKDVTTEETSEIKKILEADNTNVQQSLIHSPPIIAATIYADIKTEVSAGNEERPTSALAHLEEDPDPLRDIEKFIEDGVNLLKRGYKIGDEDSVDDVVDSKLTTIVENVDKYVPGQEKGVIHPVVDAFNTENASMARMKTEHFICEAAQLMFETPADTPISTPTVTPPPKSPLQEESVDETSLRRSHRIKQITRTPKALVGRGLVRDKERISMKDDVETKSHYSLDDHLMDLAEVEAKNAKFLKDMEERLSNFQVIKENEYKCERVVSREARKMLCDCFLTSEEEERGELGCGEDCLNRLLMIECGPDCNVKDRCTNKRFQKFLCSPCRVFRTEKKGFGIMADIEILPGEFIMEYVGEVINGDEFERRRTIYSQEKNRHYYFMALRSDAIIDATIKGNISRFINHSCDPNAETQKWTVNGELRIGFFSRKSIMPGEEITFDYQYQRYGREAQRCYCEASNCRGWIGEEPNSDEGEQLVEVDSDEDNLAASLLDDDDDEDDSDESVADAGELQKKLEIAAAEAKLISINGIGKLKQIDERNDSLKEKRRKPAAGEEDKKYGEEDSKSKLKKLLSKMAEKVAAKKKKQKQKEQDKKQRKRNTHSSSDSSPGKSRYLEDPDIEDEVHFLSRCGLKNQSDTLRLSRLMVRAKLVQTRLDLLQILRKGELPCRRLFLDYHGLRLLHGWMSEDGGDMNTRMSLLQTLESLPIANKSVLTDSKVYQMVENWCGTASGNAISTRNSLSPSDESSKESSSSNSQQAAPTTEPIPTELQKLATKLLSTWDSLPEIFRIPKRERIEQMKEHEREADRQYAAAVVKEDYSKLLNTDRYQRDRFGRSLSNRFAKPHGSKEMRNISTMIGSTSETRRRAGGVDSGATPIAAADNTKHLSKEQRRELFAAKVARDEAEKRLAEERREFETKCRFFGLDHKRTRPQDMPFYVNPANGQWYSVERQQIPTPPSYIHVQVPVKPKSSDPLDYQLPAVVNTLPPEWKYAITPQGKLYYYHVQFRIAQWGPPTLAQMHGREDKSRGTTQSDCESDDADTPEDSTDDDDEIIMSMDSTRLKAYIEKKIETRRQQRYSRLVDERAISPRREEDRIYNQLEVRKYKENKEKIRKRKEEIRRRRVQALRYSTSEDKNDSGPDIVTGSEGAVNCLDANCSDDEQVGALPIQDYLLSSDEEDIIKAECNNSPLLQKIVEGDKIVDELDALTTNRTLKRVLPPHRELFIPQTSASVGASSSISSLEKQEHKKRKLEKREKSKKSKESDSKYRKLKEKFRCEIAGIIVPHLRPYRKDSCLIGRIQNDEDFNHLARKLTHFVMIKELKYCESVGQTLVVTESVKNKSREFIKKYMAKYGDVYEKPKNDPEFKDIPFTL